MIRHDVRRRCAAAGNGGTPPGGHRYRGTVRRLLPYALRFFRRHKGALIGLAAWSLLESVQTFLVGFAVAWSLDRGFLAGRPAEGLAWLAVAAASVLLAGPVLRGVFRRLSGLVEPFRDGLVRRAADQALGRAVADPARAAEAERAAVSRLTRQTEIARDGFAGLVLTVRSFAFTAVGAVAGMAALAPELLPVVLPPMALGLLLFLLTLLPMAAAQRRYLDADEAFTDRSAALRTGLRDLVACGTTGTAGSGLHGLAAEAEAAGRSLARWTAVRTLALGAAGQLPVVALLAAVPWLLDRGVSAGALMGALTYLVQSLLPALRTMMTAVAAAGSRLVVVLERFVPPEGQEPDAPAPQGAGGQEDAAPVPADGGAPPAVLCRDLRVSYGAGTPPLLEGFDLAVAAGEHVAVVGPSGIGKSTLAHVLTGLHSPDHGDVLLSGAPVRGRASPPMARARVLLPQEGYVFAGTVRENLAQLAPEAGDGRISEAVAALRLGPLVERLGGLEADVDPAALSAGERQLLCLGRAHASPAPLLILDEATCHLDPDTEAHAEEALARREGTTLLVIAHRLSSALRADRIVVLDGTSTAVGTHRELLRTSPLYRDLAGYWEAPG
ncbi:ATP-binding cassette domain-containing protein [Nocardiopsis suaedae]|uniref:ABC transporter ATP-binding protein n=1 Tax=Nocardiopsis suaedae TaxID=3018444 RepID=A0ABT4THQ2_9ACTN|nr:ABC transporter ATP-binding protein [Nocardiopsis suaedae]MDA2804238.1 ABC transporter ATP-binding protein [Nocardiopsis suaedae]